MSTGLMETFVAGGAAYRVRSSAPLCRYVDSTQTRADRHEFIVGISFPSK